MTGPKVGFPSFGFNPSSRITTFRTKNKEVVAWRVIDGFQSLFKDYNLSDEEVIDWMATQYWFQSLFKDYNLSDISRVKVGGGDWYSFQSLFKDYNLSDQIDRANIEFPETINGFNPSSRITTFRTWKKRCGH